MAQRRMFSPQIIDSDAFLDMSTSAQALYFHLGMRADDDGFVGNPKKILRTIGVNDDDLKILMAKRFILSFESGVIVIKHWLIHNSIRADIYQETPYKKEKLTIGLNENGAYTELRKGVHQIKKVETPKWLIQRRNSAYRKRTANVPQTALRLGKVRSGKILTGEQVAGNENDIEKLTKYFLSVKPSDEQPKRYFRAAGEVLSLCNNDLGEAIDKVNTAKIWFENKKIEWGLETITRRFLEIK